MVVIFHKHIVLSVKLRKSERMNVSHKIPTGTGTAYSSVPVPRRRTTYETDVAARKPRAWSTPEASPL